eukprot:1185658-Prorocentrum_minimum.AAC.3
MLITRATHYFVATRSSLNKKDREVVVRSGHPEETEQLVSRSAPLPELGALLAVDELDVGGGPLDGQHRPVEGVSDGQHWSLGQRAATPGSKTPVSHLE